MNKQVILKCIEELRKPKPNKAYVLGMLEALSDMATTAVQTPVATQTVVEKPNVYAIESTAPSAVKSIKTDPEGDLETPEQRAQRLSHPKVPAAFSSKMYLDPGKTGGVTDVTQTQ